MPTYKFAGKLFTILFCLLFALIACRPSSSQIAVQTPVLTSTITQISTPSYTSNPALSPTAIPTVETQAIVLAQEPAVPVIAYHQFMPDGISASSLSGHKIQMEDFRAQLQSLYDVGFSLISLGDWLDGNLSIAPGRRPLVISMDDLFFRNQLLLDSNGRPQSDTGIGALWDFSQVHPDFGFHMALFAVLGDKFYPSDPADDPNWEDKLAAAIVWCLDNDAMVYNHTWKHADLNTTPIGTFSQQLKANDNYLRSLLKKAGRDDLIPKLGNILALPGGIEPQSPDDWSILKGYTNQEGISLQAVLGTYSAAEDPTKWKYMPSPYNDTFDRYRIPRVVANIPNIEYLVANKDLFPAAQTCQFQLEENRRADLEYLTEQIDAAIQKGTCPFGLYFLNGFTIDARKTPARLAEIVNKK
jgi:hypothetical protein